MRFPRHDIAPVNSALRTARSCSKAGQLGFSAITSLLAVVLVKVMMEVTGASCPDGMDMAPTEGDAEYTAQNAGRVAKDEAGMAAGTDNTPSASPASEPANAAPAPEIQDQGALKQEPAASNEAQSSVSKPMSRTGEAGAPAPALEAEPGHIQNQGANMEGPSAASEHPQSEIQAQPIQRAEALSFEQVYEQIMRQKREANAQANHSSQQTGTAAPMQPQQGSQPGQSTAPNQSLPQVVVRAPSYVVLPDGSLAITAGAWNATQPTPGQQLAALQVPRTSTLDNVLNSFLGGSLDIGLVGWSSLAPEKFMEGLASDMKEIAAQPPDAQAMRHTFNIERIVSGGAGDLQALVREAAGQPHQAITLAGGAGVTTALMEAHAQQPQQAGSQSQTAQHSDSGKPTAGLAGPSNSTKPSQPATTTLSAPTAVVDAQQAGCHTNSQQQDQVQPVMRHSSASQTSLVGLLPNGAVASGAATQRWGANANGMLPQAADGASPSPAVQLLQQEITLWERGNQELQQQLDMLLDQVDYVQQENYRMKLQLLDTCARSGIQADMLQLNSTIASHRPAAMPDATAVSVAAAALGDNGGDVSATIRQLLMAALQGSAGPTNGMAMADLGQPSGISGKMPMGLPMDLQGTGYQIQRGTLQQPDNVKMDVTAAAQQMMAAQHAQHAGMASVSMQGWSQQARASTQQHAELGPGKPPPQQQHAHVQLQQQQQQGHMQLPQQQRNLEQMVAWGQSQQPMQLQAGPQGQVLVSTMQGRGGQQVVSLVQAPQTQGNLQPGMHHPQYAMLSQQQPLQQPGSGTSAGNSSQRGQGVQLVASGPQGQQLTTQGPVGGGQLQVAPLTVHIPSQALGGNAVLLNGQGVQVIGRHPSQGTQQLLGMLSDGARVFQSGSMDLSALLASMAGTPTTAPSSAMAPGAQPTGRPAQPMFFG